MTINFQNYTVIRECKGNQANKIYIVEDKESKQMMILKLIKIYDLEKQLREIEVHKKLHYKFVIKMLDYDISKTHIILLIEYAKYGDLFSILPKLRDIPEKRLLKFYYQFLKAMDYLHTQGFVHRDIKPENILITKKFSPRLADFGTSAKTDFVKNTFCGTYEYMAPEIYQRHKQTEKVDIWALGVLLYEMTHQFTPFKKKSVPEIKKMLDDGKIEFRKDLNPLIKDFILRILKFNPAERPSTTELLADPLFSDFSSKHNDGVKSPMDMSPTKFANNFTIEVQKPDENITKQSMEDFKESDLIDRKVITHHSPNDNSKLLAPNHGSKTPLKKVSSYKQYTSVNAYSFKSNSNLDLLKTKSKNELTRNPVSQSSQRNLKIESFKELTPAPVSNDEKNGKVSYKDLVSNKAVVSSLYKIKSMFDEYREADNVKTLVVNDHKTKPSSGAKLPNNSKFGSNSYTSQSGSTNNLFKNLFSKLVKAPTSNIEQKEPINYKGKPGKKSLANPIAKKPFVSLASFDTATKQINSSFIKKQLMAFAKTKNAHMKPEPAKIQNVAYSIEELH